MCGEPELSGGDLPSPIPWLGVAGSVAPLDRPPSSEPAPKLIQIRKPGSRALRANASAAVASASKSTALRAVNAASAPAAVANSGGPSAPIKPKKTGPKRPGSGIPARKVIQILVWVRRVSQVGFVSLFLFFLARHMRRTKR